MASDPAPFDLVPRLCGVECLPQVDILDRFARSSFPAARLPAVNPFADAFLYILAVGINGHVAGTVEYAQRLDDGLEFHAIVGGAVLTAAEFFLMVAGDQQRAPATFARISLAGAIGVNDDFAHFFFIHICFVVWSLRLDASRAAFYSLWMRLVAGTPFSTFIFRVRQAGPIRRMPWTRLIACTI